MNNKTAAICCAIAAFICNSRACGPCFQPSYLRDFQPYKLELRKDAARQQFLYSIRDLLKHAVKFPEGVSTVNAEKQDFAAAVKKYLPQLDEAGQQKLVKLYHEFIVSWRKNPALPLDTLDHLPPELAEFKLYLAGYRELLFNPALDVIPAGWAKLLSLPPEKRFFRTVWVHYMLGNHFKAELHTHYDNCRNAVRQGFADSAGLARRSYILELRNGKDPLRQLRRAAEGALCHPELDLLAGIRIDFDKIDDGTIFALICDPVCREYLAIFWNTPKFRRLAVNFKIRNADICAFQAYDRGMTSEAEKFLRQLPAPTLLSCYIEAKIQRYRGNTARAVQLLRQWLKFAGQIKPGEQTELLMRCGYSEDTMEQEIYGMLGNTMIARRDFTDAAGFFFQAGQYDDLCHVAEQFMTTAELEKFAGTLKAADKAPLQAIKRLHHLLARRAFREGNFELAARWMPDEYKKFIPEYCRFLQIGNDTSKSGDERALALYNAAKILRLCGMELSGTEGAPDFFPGGLGIGFPDGECRDHLNDRETTAPCHYDPALGEWFICAVHIKNINRTLPGFNAVTNHCRVPEHQRFHYRYRAAELALRAGELAEDDDLRALIHLFGGSCLQLRSPQEADIFYKRLVLNSRKSRLSGLADRLRWFPKVPLLQKEISDPAPLSSLKKLKELMKTAFPAE